jgi:hypothetical protein
MQQAAPQTAQEIHETLYDGADVSVTFVGSVPGQSPRTEMVKVRKVPRSEFPSLALLIGDESEQAEFREAALYCAKDETWARSLDEASLDRVLAEGQRLNFSSFARWFRRRARMPGLLQDQTALIQLATEALTLLQPRDFTNGSSPRATGTAISGVTRPTS